jgi:hypothetical protein
VSQENLLPSRRMNWLKRVRFRLFLFLRLVSQPAYYYYGLGDFADDGARYLSRPIGRAADVLRVYGITPSKIRLAAR